MKPRLYSPMRNLFVAIFASSYKRDPNLSNLENQRHLSNHVRKMIRYEQFKALFAVPLLLVLLISMNSTGLLDQPHFLILCFSWLSYAVLLTYLCIFTVCVMRKLNLVT